MTVNTILSALHVLTCNVENGEEMKHIYIEYMYIYSRRDRIYMYIYSR